MRERRAFSEAQKMRREKQQHEASVAFVVREALKARRTRISAMLEQHTIAHVRWILAQIECSQWPQQAGQGELEALYSQHHIAR
jgi:hypothetical protein